MIAAEQGRTDVVKTLLELGAQVSAKGPSGLTALIAAANSGRLPIVEMLLKNGADPTAEL